MVKTPPKIINKLAIALAIAATSTLAAGCFGGSFAFAVMPADGPRVSCAPGQVHVKGYYEYQGGEYVWVTGRCVQPRSGCKWVAGRYKVKRRGNVKIKTWKPGHWNCGNKPKVVVVKPKPNKKVVVVKPKAKPQPKIIVVNPPPPKEKARKVGKGKIWIPGHYAWNGKTKSYTWIKGRMKKVKPGKRWVPGRYKVEVRGGYKIKIWIPGSWR